MFTPKNLSRAGTVSRLVPDTTSPEQNPAPPPAAITHLSRGTFAAKFCVRRHITMEHYEETVLKLALYPLARHLRTFLGLSSSYFNADRDFICGAGRCTRMSEFEREVQEFVHDPASRGFLRQTLDLRVSTRRLRRLVSELLEPEACADGAEPLPASDADDQSRAR